MKRWTSVAVSLAIVAGLRPAVARAGPTPPAWDVGKEVRAAQQIQRQVPVSQEG